MPRHSALPEVWRCFPPKSTRSREVFVKAEGAACLFLTSTCLFSEVCYLWRQESSWSSLSDELSPESFLERNCTSVSSYYTYQEAMPAQAAQLEWSQGGALKTSGGSQVVLTCPLLLHTLRRILVSFCDVGWVCMSCGTLSGPGTPTATETK